MQLLYGGGIKFSNTQAIAPTATFSSMPIFPAMWYYNSIPLVLKPYFKGFYSCISDIQDSTGYDNIFYMGYSCLTLYPKTQSISSYTLKAQ